MGRAREVSKIFSRNNSDLVTTDELNTAVSNINNVINNLDLSPYLTASSASVTYATKDELSSVEAVALTS